MKISKSARMGFILMGIFIVEILGLVQGVFSAQAIKYDLEIKLEQNAQMLLEQFVASYESTAEIQKRLDEVTLQRQSSALMDRFEEVQAVVALKGASSGDLMRTGSELYNLELIENTQGSRNVIEQRYGIKLMGNLKPQVVSYSMKQNEKNLYETQIILGYSKDMKWIITLELNEKKMLGRLESTQRKLASLLNSEYYFSDNTGNFYVFTGGGKLIYQGGFEKNANYFVNKDLNTNQSVIDLIRNGESRFLRVIYPIGDHTKRSLMRTQYDNSKDLYFVYETDQVKAFETVDLFFKVTWIVGVLVLLLTFMVIWLVWNFRFKDSF